MRMVSCQYGPDTEWSDDLASCRDDSGALAFGTGL